MSKSGNHVRQVWKENNTITNPAIEELYLDTINQVASLFSIGQFYYYIFNFTDLQMEYVHEGINNVLGLEQKDYTLEKLFEVIHPDDLANLAEKEKIATSFLYETINRDEILDYKVSYLMRLKHLDGTYKTILHQAKTLTLSHEKQVQQVIGIHTDVTFLNIPMNDKVSFISNNRPCYYGIQEEGGFAIKEYNYASIFTRREIDVIKQVSRGLDSKTIAKILYISPHTVNTHKKNILKKTNCKNTAELMVKCFMEGIV
ncbi:helix-turn-helix transcriptional regulator [Seonamhaeicola sediminis]|uniref:Helix-turn-helix transcriptional regulator n=1 Tax=Seonamhaeicola sediminis TaxID=2528206 RepID=A0A562YFP6_9FLAO|nr:helix-turn-helix transcriptional regulator [Seonamhaeicola sediminis]TWO33689.1 helix-turn-helix transcriptional regulator [Seonamhaeicola sediminis]